MFEGSCFGLLTQLEHHEAFCSGYSIGVILTSTSIVRSSVP